MEQRNNDLSSLKISRSKREGNPDGNKNFITYAVIVSVIIIIALLLKFGWNYLFSPSVEVKLTMAAMQSSAQSDAILTASGYVVAQRKAAVASKGTGRLVYLGVVEGDRVKKDEVFARLEDNDIRAQLEQAKANLKLNEANLKEAENNFKRQKELFASASTTQMEVDAAETAYLRTVASIDLAKAQVSAAEVAMENTLIRAPFDGTVLTKNADVGEIVAPLAAGINSRAAVVTIADMNSLQVEADVSESYIQKIKPDQACQITLDAYPSHPYQAYVAKIVPTADRSKATVLVKVGFKNYDSKVLPEMSAKVIFLGDKNESENQEVQPPVLTVPESAIAERGGRLVVFMVKDNTAVAIPVITGKTGGGFVEIKSGISAGDEIIDNIDSSIVNGIKVRVK